MTNSIILLTVISTNWLPMNIQQPNGDGTSKEIQHEIGILVSNRMAHIVADGKTNKILVSSEPMPPSKFLIRDKMVTINMTNLAWPSTKIYSTTNAHGNYYWNY